MRAKNKKVITTMFEEIKSKICYERNRKMKKRLKRKKFSMNKCVSANER